MAEPIIDRATIRVALRQLRNEDIYNILGEALEMLPWVKAQNLIKGYIDLSQFRRNISKTNNLLEEIKEFQHAQPARRLL